MKLTPIKTRGTISTRTIILITLGVLYSLVPALIIALKYNGDDVTVVVIIGGLLLTLLPYCLGILGGISWKEDTANLFK